MADILERESLHHVAFREWQIPGRTILERTFAALAFAEWSSYTLALLDGFDPTPVELVERFKTALVSPPDAANDGTAPAATRHQP
jgi:hypothetical protein